MRQQRGTAGVVEDGEPVPELGLILRQVGLPGLVPFRDRLGGRAVLQVRRLDREEHLVDRRFEAIAGCRVLEGVEAELVQERRHRDLRVVRHGLPQRQRPVCGQLAHQPIRERLDGIILVLLRLCLAADRDDGALDGGCRRLTGIAVGLWAAIDVHGGWRLVLGAYVATIDRELAIRVDADEDAGAGDLGGVVADRPILEGGERRLDFAEARVHLVGQFVGVLVFGFEFGVLGLQGIDRRLLLGREVCWRPVELAQTMGVAEWEVDIHLDPLPAFGGDLLRLGLQLLGDQACRAGRHFPANRHRPAEKDRA